MRSSGERERASEHGLGFWLYQGQDKRMLGFTVSLLISERKAEEQEFKGKEEKKTSGLSDQLLKSTKISKTKRGQ